jgi:multiple sugar transport system permease protein
MKIATSPSPFPELDDQPRVRQPRFSGSLLAGNGLLLLVGALFGLPLLWLFFAAVNSQAGWNISLPHLTLANFGSSLEFGRAHALFVSAELAVIATVVSTVAGSFAAYTFSRRHIPWKGPLLLFILFLSAVPVNVLIIPIFQVFSEAGWLSIVPTGIFLGITSLPFAIWIIKNFIDEVPTELEEAARIEGAGTLRIIRKIVVPLAAPGIGAAAIFGFVNAWGSFLIPLVLISNSAQQPAAVAIFGFTTSTGVNYGDIAAYSLIYSAPVVLLYIALGRFFKGGFALGGAIK